MKSTMKNAMEKKNYEKPTAEKMAFCYRDQVVAASAGDTCTDRWVNIGDVSCTSGNAHLEHLG